MNDSKQKKVLVLGAGDYQLSGIQKIIEKGYYVIALDGNENASGKSVASEFGTVDILDFNAVDDYLKTHDHTDIVSCQSFCTDAPMHVLGKVVKEYKIAGIPENLTTLSTDKSLQREVLKETGLPTPSFQLIEDKSDDIEIELPFIVKPVDSAGSRGVSLVRDKAAIEKAIEEALSIAKNGKCIVESFIQGTEYTVESMISDGKVYTLGISEKRKPLGNYTVSSELHYNSPNVQLFAEQIETVIQQFFEAAHYDNSIVHSELIRSQKDGRFYMIESSLRSGGFAIFDEVLPYLTNDDVVGNTVDLYLGLKPNIKEAEERSVIMNFLSANPGKIAKLIDYKERYKNFISAKEKHGFLKKVGDEVKGLKADGDRVAYILTFANSWEEAFKLSKLIEYSIVIETE